MKTAACFLLLSISGCNTSVTSAKKVDSTSTTCPDKPPGSLDGAQVKPVALSTQAVKESGMLRPSESKAYTFEAEAGQKLSYRTSENTCAWIFTPDNQVLNSTELPVKGKYIMQLSALTGSSTFDIEMSLREPKQASQIITSQPESVDSTASQDSEQVAQSDTPEFESVESTASQYSGQFSRSDFPQSSCGDSLPSDSSEYPINFYPVFVPYSQENLAKARSYFCQDSIKLRRKDNRELAVQLASFTSREKAVDFASFLSSELDSSDVGEPTVVYERY